jgi:hypothetical protein
MEIKSVSPDVFASTNKDKSKVFAISNIKSINGEVVGVISLYAAKQYGADVIVQTTELHDSESTIYDVKNIVQSEDDAIAMALNAIV